MKQLILLITLFSAGISWSQNEPIAPPAPPKSEPEIFHIVDEPAQFPGGMEALRQFFAENLVYPEEAKAAGITGKCYVQFIVSALGNVSNVTVKRGVTDCPACDKEVIRVVKLMPKWIPGTIKGKAVNSVFNLPVTFTAPKPVEEPQK